MSPLTRWWHGLRVPAPHKVESEARRDELQPTRGGNSSRKIAQGFAGLPASSWLACFQALKSVVLIVTAFLLHFRPGETISAQSLLYPLLYIAMRGNVSALKNALDGGWMLPALILAFGAYLGYIATGLWDLKPFARRALMLTSGLTFLLYLKSAVLSNGDGTMSGMNFFSPSLHNVHILLFIDTAIFVYLTRGVTANHFRMQGRRA